MRWQINMFILESTLENKEILRKDFAVRFLKTTFFFRRAALPVCNKRFLESYRIAFKNKTSKPELTDG